MQGVPIYTTPSHLLPPSKTQSHGQIEVSGAEKDGVNRGSNGS